MTARYRTRNLRVAQTGSFVRPVLSPTRTYRTVNCGLSQTCEDEIGNRLIANRLLLKTNLYQTQFLEGKRIIGSTIHQDYSGWPVPETIDVILPSPNVTFGTLSTLKLQELAWELIAKTNPSEPHVSLPQVVAEMRDWQDIPKMLKAKGESGITRTAKYASSANLTWRWGIKPLVSDLKKLFDFTAAVEKRLAWLNTLHETGSLRRKARLGQGSVASTPTTYFSSTSSGFSIQSRRQDLSTHRVWGSVQYRTTVTTSLPSTIEGRAKLASRLTHGITTWSAVSLAWELTPWSWLIDWFSNFGTLIKAMNNTIPLAWTNVCIMRQSSCQREERIITPIPSTVRVIGQFGRTEVWKERHPVFPFLPFFFSIPVLKPGQWSILGSLAILKGVKT